MLKVISISLSFPFCNAKKILQSSALQKGLSRKKMQRQDVRMNNKPTLLGPFIGHTTSVSSKIWIYSETHKKLFIKIYQEEKEIHFAEFLLHREIPACCITIPDL